VCLCPRAARPLCCRRCTRRRLSPGRRGSGARACRSGRLTLRVEPHLQQWRQRSICSAARTACTAAAPPAAARAALAAADAAAVARRRVAAADAAFSLPVARRVLDGLEDIGHDSRESGRPRLQSRSGWKHFLERGPGDCVQTQDMGFSTHKQLLFVGHILGRTTLMIVLQTRVCEHVAGLWANAVADAASSSRPHSWPNPHGR
jgi:cytochrome c5